MAVSEWDVQEGDNIWDIAAKLHMSYYNRQPTTDENIRAMQELIQLNMSTLKGGTPGKADLIYPGQKLKVPGSLGGTPSPGSAIQNGKGGNQGIAPDGGVGRVQGPGLDGRDQEEMQGSSASENDYYAPGSQSGNEARQQNGPGYARGLRKYGPDSPTLNRDGGGGGGGGDGNGPGGRASRGEGWNNRGGGRVRSPFEYLRDHFDGATGGWPERNGGVTEGRGRTPFERLRDHFDGATGGWPERNGGVTEGRGRAPWEGPNGPRGGMPGVVTQREPSPRGNGPGGRASRGNGWQGSL